MFRACKPSVPRTSIDNPHSPPCPPAATVPPAAEPLQYFGTPSKKHTSPPAPQQLKEKPLPTPASPTIDDQPPTCPPNSGAHPGTDGDGFEMGWEFRTVMEPVLTPDEMSEDLSRDVRPERRIDPHDDPLLNDMFAFFSGLQSEQ